MYVPSDINLIMLIFCPNLILFVLFIITDKSSYDALLQFSWDSILQEFENKFPEVFQLTLGLITTEASTEEHVETIIPKLGLIYGVLAHVI